MARSKVGGVLAFLIFGAFFLFIIILIFEDESSSSSYSDGPYKMAFSEEFNTAVANQDDLGLSVVLAIDVSGSMDEAPKTGGIKAKYQEAADSLTEILTFLQDFQRKNPGLLLKIGLIKFSDTPETVFKLTEMNDESFRRILAITRDSTNFAPQSGTAIGLAMEKSVEMLMQSGTIFRSLIVVTDGMNNGSLEPETVLEAMAANKTNKSGGDFPVLTNTILTSFVGFDVGSGVFGSLAPLGARITAAVNKEELQDSLKKIFMADISQLEAAGPGK